MPKLRPVNPLFTNIASLSGADVETAMSTNRRPYRPLADLTSQELLRRAAEYRQMAITARGQDTYEH